MGGKSGLSRASTPRNTRVPRGNGKCHRNYTVPTYWDKGEMEGM